ncbi:MAG: ribose 5-phosphate isomerase B [Bacteroidota bacterium]|nr:ribose 5-phosphate isomerase B [Bacteroidota bacterium]
MAKKFITENDIRSLVQQGKKELIVDKETALTPAAKDAVHQFKIILIQKEDQPKQVPQQTSSTSYHTSPVSQTAVGGNLVVIGSDHGGFSVKEMLKKYLHDLGYKVLDVGTNSEEACDYPDYAYAVARIVAKGEAWRGIMVDGTGVASCIACNKVPGVRAAACYSEVVAQSSREHNDANVLTLGAKTLGEAAIKSIVKVWLETWFGGGRHKKRVDKISDVERKFSK